jgi:hypothetical protein
LHFLSMQYLLQLQHTSPCFQALSLGLTEEIVHLRAHHVH